MLSQPIYNLKGTCEETRTLERAGVRVRVRVRVRVCVTRMHMCMCACARARTRTGAGASVLRENSATRAFDWVLMLVDKLVGRLPFG
jgi:hypothetical protein